MPFNSNSSKIIGIAGKIASGKTTLAARLSLLTAGRIASFGLYVRSQAKIRGILENRSNLQELGENLITEFGEIRFVEQALDLKNSHDKVLIIDGVRHKAVWEAITKVTSLSVLVYLDISENMRVERLKLRGDVDAINSGAMNHPMELNIAQLEPISDFVFQTTVSERDILEISNALVDTL